MAVNKVQLSDGTTIIDLTGDTISAGDALVGVSLHLATGETAVGTLTDFNGATANADGEHGLVPAPEAGDQNKVLKGDGTWGTVAIPTASSSTVGGIKVTQTEGFSVGNNGELVAERASTTRDGFMTSAHYTKLYMLPTGTELANNYQTKLVSGTSIKTVNGTSLLGSGDVTITVPITVKKTLTLTANGWLQDSDSTYKYFASISGVDLTSVTDALVDVDMSNATVSTATDLLEDWSLVGRVYIDTTGAWFVCYGEPPIGNLPVILRLTVEG